MDKNAMLMGFAALGLQEGDMIDVDFGYYNPYLVTKGGLRDGGDYLAENTTIQILSQKRGFRKHERAKEA